MTEEKITKIDIIILKYTLKSTEGIFIAKINSTLGLSIKDSVSSFIKLNKLGLLEKKENVIFLTKKGRRWIMENQHLFALSGKKTWRDIPQKFISNSIPPFEPYAPRISRFSRKKFTFGLSKKYDIKEVK